MEYISKNITMLLKHRVKNVSKYFFLTFLVEFQAKTQLLLMRGDNSLKIVTGDQTLLKNSH